MHKENFSIFDNYKAKHENDLVYLDTAASSLTPDYVVDAMSEYYLNYRSNIDRGLYPSAVTATEKYNNAREIVAKFFHINSDETIFTSGSTDASNKLIRMLEQKLTPNKTQIIASKWCHHSDLVPLQELAKRNGLEIVLVNDESECIEKINENTFIVSMPLASNVTGNIFDIKSVAAVAHKVGAYMISDITAAAGHIDIDLHDIDPDAAYMSAHKMCGPTGAGMLYVKREILRDIQPVTFGGGMVWEVNEQSSTYRSDVRAHESGTAGIAEIIGFAAAVEYINKNNILDENKKINIVVDYALRELGKIEGVKVYSKNENNIGIVSFNIEGIHPHDIAEVLGRHHIAMRAGHHCAQIAMKTLSVPATCRVSFYFYNTNADVDAFILALKDAIKILRK
jgi:cysteine desulfurase/selenocysteine lyase